LTFSPGSSLREPLAGAPVPQILCGPSPIEEGPAEEYSYPVTWNELPGPEGSFAWAGSSWASPP
jgi:hypothetical protein